MTGLLWRLYKDVTHSQKQSVSKWLGSVRDGSAISFLVDTNSDDSSFLDSVYVRLCEYLFNSTKVPIVKLSAVVSTN